MMKCIGIHLGTNFSTVAHLNAESILTLIPDARDADSFHTPSIVHLGSNGPLVGKSAEVAALARPEIVILRNLKWSLGSAAPLAEDSTHEAWSAEEVVGLLLNKLRGDAAASGEVVDSAVIAVPVGFGNHRRQALRRAAESVGLPVRAFVDDATAAAAGFSMNQPAKRTVLVFNIGARTFDATLVRCSDGNVERLAVENESGLGGTFIDEAIAAEMRACFGEQKQIGPTESQQLLTFAEQMKIALGRPGVTQSRQQALVGNRWVEFVLTRTHIERLMASMLARCLDAVERCLAAAGGEWSHIDNVLLLGGTSELPAVRAAIASRSGLADEKIISPQTLASVAYGAAWLAARSDAQLARHTVVADDVSQESARPSGPVAAYDVGIRIGDPRSGQAAIYRLIKRNAQLPATAVRQFRTSRTDQTRLVIEVVQTRGSARRARSLGQFDLALPSGLPANHPVAVTMSYDANGQVHVTATADDKVAAASCR